MNSFHYEARASLRVPPTALWPLIADTPRLNRAVGMPPVVYTVTPKSEGGTLIQAEATFLGWLRVRWTEHAFRWEAPHRYLVVREPHGGPVQRVRISVELTPVDAGTELRYAADFQTRNLLGETLVRRFGPRAVKRVVQQCREFERYLLGEVPNPFPQLAVKGELPPQATAAAGRLTSQGLNQQIVELLRRHLAEAPDESVVKMRAFDLADLWGVDRRETLTLFLHATIAGLLVMTWDVLCPNCRVSKAEYSSLRDLQAQAHCEVCNVTFDASFDRLVEVRFSVAPALRRIDQRMYCIGGPMNTPHVVFQATIPPGASDRLTGTLAPGAYRLRSAQSPGKLMLQVFDGATGNRPGDSNAEIRPVDGGSEPGGEDRPVDPPAVLTVAVTVDAMQPSTADVHAGGVSLEIVNRGDVEQLVVLEGDLWPSTVTTAAMVSTMQEFRDLFSSEALSPGLQLGIENLAFMFTDLTSSTAMYQALGQGRAFRLVQDHFVVLGRAIAENRGALVKTIGDAVMAAFASGEDALAAAFQIQREIRELETPKQVDSARLVKIGLHQGPCLAVNLNDRLDYFGTTVNTAARIEHECRGGQIVASLAVCQTEAATGLLDDSGATVVDDVVHLRGISEPVPVYRITPSP